MHISPVISSAFSATQCVPVVQRLELAIWIVFEALGGRDGENVPVERETVMM